MIFDYQAINAEYSDDSLLALGPQPKNRIVELEKPGTLGTTFHLNKDRVLDVDYLNQYLNQ